ncbi:GNAT family N-acetyltransferase [Actinokineospora pegani]|uniref:GNAT family N-acetyltransferase n=1 Tax=Actinokineospora pegani TaxID=2654637 RepID=UPI002E25DB0F
MDRELLRVDGDLALAVGVLSDAVALAEGEGLDPYEPDPGPEPGYRPHNLTRATVVDGGGRVLGQVSWHQVGYGRTRASGAWNIGIRLVPAARGRGVAAPLLRLVAAHLFATTDLDRVEAATAVDNVAARRAFERAGFQEEGTVRGAQVRGGVRRDMTLYGLLRGD